jgi:DNA-directed RNA polymerase specialized sigma24 family protein
VQSRVVARPSELRAFLRDEVDEVYRYALALTASPERAEALTLEVAIDLAHHVDAVAAAPVSTRRLLLAVRKKVLRERPRRRRWHREHRRADDATSVGRDPDSSVDVALGDIADAITARRTDLVATLAGLDLDARLALVLRHHDGALLSDIGELLDITMADAGDLVAKAEAAIRPFVHAAGDVTSVAVVPSGATGDPIGDLLGGLPTGPPGLVDRVWDVVDETLMPSYTLDADGRAENPASATYATWLDIEVPTGRPWESPATPPEPSGGGAKRVGVVILLGALVVGVVLGIAALTAPKNDTGPPATSPAAPTVPPSSAAAARGAAESPLPEGVPDVVVDLAGVDPHPPDRVVARPRGTATVPARQATRLRSSEVTTVVRAGVSVVTVHRPDGANGDRGDWLVLVKGQVRSPAPTSPTGSPPAWSVEGGGVVLALEVVGRPDALALVGLRPVGGGTWLRSAAGALARYALADGSVVCALPSAPTSGVVSYATYRVLT